MKLFAKIALVALVAATAGCNTVEGVGKDVQSAGEATAKAADKAK